jgi:hypothetical protein
MPMHILERESTWDLYGQGSLAFLSPLLLLKLFPVELLQVLEVVSALG